MSAPLLQVFYWSSPIGEPVDGKQHYAGFTLDGVAYTIGDVVKLHAAAPAPPYLGRIVDAFCDLSGGAEPHAIQIRWYERMGNLPLNHSPYSVELEREVVELEEIDQNPIGCISGKVTVFRARSHDEAAKAAKASGLEGTEWFFCRGVFRQATNTITLYKDLADAAHQDGGRKSRRAQHTIPEDVGDSDDIRPAAKQRRMNAGDAFDVMGDGDAERPNARRRGTGQLLAGGPVDRAAIAAAAASAGRCCVECGATSTPQWREGPLGPKTLCNACGVRYVRAQQRANKRASGGAVAAKPAAAQGAMRAAAAASPAQPAAKTPKAATKTARAHVAAAAAAAASVAAAAVAAAVSPAASPCMESQSARPMRQAALLAANKTAEFARTGVFPMDLSKPASIKPSTPGGESTATRQLLQHQQQHNSSSNTHSAKQAAAGARRQVNSHDSSLTSSDSAEEVVYAPGSGAQQQQQQAADASALACARVGSSSLQQQPAAAGSPEQQGTGDAAVAAAAALATPTAGMHQRSQQQAAAGEAPAGSTPATVPVKQQGSGELQQQAPQQLSLLTPEGANSSALQPPQQQHHEQHQQALQQQQQQPAMQAVAAQQQQQQQQPVMVVAPTTPAPQVPDVDLKGVASRAAAFVPEVAQYDEVFDHFDALRGVLPVEAMSKLGSVTEAVDRATNEAAMAEAALQAVHQVLLSRQEAAQQARKSAADAVAALRSYVDDLLKQYRSPTPGCTPPLTGGSGSGAAGMPGMPVMQPLPGPLHPHPHPHPGHSHSPLPMLRQPSPLLHKGLSPDGSAATREYEVSRDGGPGAMPAPASGCTPRDAHVPGAAAAGMVPTNMGGSGGGGLGGAAGAGPAPGATGMVPLSAVSGGMDTEPGPLGGHHHGMGPMHHDHAAHGPSMLGDPMDSMAMHGMQLPSMHTYPMDGEESAADMMMGGLDDTMLSPLDLISVTHGAHHHHRRHPSDMSGLLGMGHGPELIAVGSSHQ